MAIKLGAQVRQVVRVIEGTVVDRRFNESADSMEYLVEDGDGGQRWMLESSVEEKPAAAGGEGA